MNLQTIKNLRISLRNPATRVVVVALAANGASSYRDASAISRKLDGAQVTVLTDSAEKVRDTNPRTTTVTQVRRKADLTQALRQATQGVPAHGTLLFVLSAHGYSRPAAPARRDREMNRRTEYVRVGPDILCDYELRAALLGHLPATARAVCLVDTCHSGTMLDMEYVFRGNGTELARSLVPLETTPAECVSISACADNELAGEDISTFGGWGGKLVCQFLDYLGDDGSFGVYGFFQHAHAAFTGQSCQRSHPVLGYSPLYRDTHD